MSESLSVRWTSILALVLALTALVLVLSGWGSQRFVLSEESQQVLSVSGNSEMSLTPDRAEVFIRIQTHNQDPEDAQAENRKRSERVREALIDAGVRADDLETTEYRLQRIEEYNRQKGQQEFKGYQQNQVMRLTTEDLEKIGQYIDAAVEAGANGVDHVNFALTEDRQETIRKDALKKASAEARSKAETLAEELGVSLGNPVRVSESRFDYQPYRSTVAMTEAKRQSDNVPGTKVSPEKVTVTAGVNVDVRID